MAMERENRAPRAGGPNRKRKKVCQFCAMQQRQLTEAIKRARQIALLPFVTE